VVLARNQDRAAALAGLTDQGADLVVGDLASQQQTRELAVQVNQLGSMDAVVHNAGVYADEQRFPTAEGHPRLFAVNVLAPYLLTTLIDRPGRLIYLTSDMQAGGNPTMTDLDWTTPPMERRAGLPGQQTIPDDPRVRYRKALAAGPQQRDRPRLGAHPDGRPARPR
jgi:NAD(P)-dependent dehydrogenase (short-subunit alcohol dehydrogenase family)